MIRKLIFVFSSAGVVLFGWLLAHEWRSERPSASGPVAFTIHSTAVSQLAVGPPTLTIVKIVAARAEGSYYELQANLAHAKDRSVTGVTIWDQPASRYSVLYPLVRAVTTYSSHPGQAAVPECGCTKGILEGRPSGRFLGYRVLETREEQAIEDRPASEGNRVQRGSESERKSGKRVSKDWFLPELNCLRVYGETRVIDSEGKLFSTYLYRVNSITVGEPDDRLFVVPPEYQEMPPSKALKMELEAVDPTRYAFLVSSGRLSKLEMEYESSRLVFRPKKLLPVK